MTCEVRFSLAGARRHVDTSEAIRTVALDMAPAQWASGDFVQAAKAERDLLTSRLAEAGERVAHFEALVAEVRAEINSLTASIRSIEEVAGLAPQLAICEISEALRGERLREVALDVLQRLVAEGNPIHYRAWFQALVESGYSVTGRDPLAVFLTQITRIDRVESLGGRSGLYRLRVAA